LPARRAGADRQRQVALENHVEELRQLIELVLRMKRPTRVTRLSFLVTTLAASGSA